MRCILLATLVGLGLAASVQTPAAQNPLTEPVCASEKLIALSDELGRNLCVQKSILENLSVTGPELVTAARVVLKRPIRYEKSSDPDAITCRQNLEPLNTRLMSPVRCAYNKYWAIRDKYDVTGNGVPSPFDTNNGTPQTAQ